MFEETSALGRVARVLAMALAMAGGMVLVAMVALVVVSIVGRALILVGLRPVTGDYELVSIGMGFAVFAFMPWVHLERGHAMVTLLTDRFPPRVNAWILVVTDLMMLLAASFVAWRLYDGMLDKFAYRETTLLLRFPLSWAYAAGLVGAVGWVLVALVVFGRSLSNGLQGRMESRRAGGEV